MTERPADVRRRKREFRGRMCAACERQPNRGSHSAAICRKLESLPEFAEARTIMFYVDFDAEVRTRPSLATLLGRDKRIVVPYCVAGEIELFLLRSLDELAAGTLGILEPRVELRSRGDRRIDPRELDLIVVPGMAFDRRGGRLGHGKGYYDRLLARTGAHTVLIALAFECQLVDEVPVLPHDVYVHKVITEKAIYPDDGE